MKKLILVFCLIPGFARALNNGGARDFREFQQIEAGAAQMRSSCPIRANISPELEQKITRNLAYNELSCKPGNLLEWDSKAGEYFPSIGLPHVVCFPPGTKHVVDESFPRMWDFIKTNYKGFLKIPNIPPGTCPWASKAELANSPLSKELNRILQDPEVMRLQAKFAIQRGLDSIHKILAANALDPKPKMSNTNLCRHFQNLVASDQGVLNVVDYANWKGEGTHWTEVTDRNQVRWGLKQVLESLGEPVSPLADQRLFADAALKTLQSRADDDARIAGVMPGLRNRIDRTYRNGGITPEQCSMVERRSDAGPTRSAPAQNSGTST